MSPTIPAQIVKGDLYWADDQCIFVINPEKEQFIFRYALLTLGSEERVFPELVLDDWGHERKGLVLYRWVYMNGYQFPRAEVFGRNMDGGAEQLFLRELDLSSRCPTYVYGSIDVPLSEGCEISTIIDVRSDAHETRRVKYGTESSWPLRNAAAAWWQAPPGKVEKLVAALLE